jgi:hypothetical protein
MNSLRIGNTNNPPYGGLNTNIVNPYGSGVVSFNSSIVPNGPHTIIKGGKNKKISRNNKMKSKKYGCGRTRRLKKRRNRRARRSRRYHMKGGMPNYTAGNSQYLNNNGGMSNTYSLGGHLSAGHSMLATPPPVIKLAGEPDNYNHYTNTGFPSRGWH